MLRDGNVTLMVSDMNSAIQFYVEKLGLMLKARYSDQFAQVVAPGLTIALHPLTKKGGERENHKDLRVSQSA
jgi:catechol 2,3-dioxygenase-like lactoylglutathione lyase family enzyme